MIEKLLSKLIEQSLDELQVKNLALVVPLTSIKIENICRSTVGIAHITVDCAADVSDGDFCVIFTNASDDSVLFIKNIDRASDSKRVFLEQVMSARKLSLQLENGHEAEIPLPNFSLVAFLSDRHEFDDEISRYFNFWVEISASELPSPSASLEESYEELQSEDPEDDMSDLADHEEQIENSAESELENISTLINANDGAVKKVSFEIELQDSDRIELANLQPEFLVPRSDTEMWGRLADFVDTQNPESLCFLVYRMLCVHEWEREASNCSYFDQFQMFMNGVHDRFREIEYKIRVNGILVDGVAVPVSQCESYEWWDMFEAYHDGLKGVSISNGFGDYSNALSEMK